MRRFLRRLPDGGQQAVLQLSSLSWEVMLDSRNITPIANGAPIPLWPDTSGHGRDANPVPGFNPRYRPANSAGASPKGLPMADFGSVPNSQMFGTLPAGGLDPTLGFSLYAYYVLDSVPATSGFDSQIVFGDDIAGGFRMFASLFQGVGDTRPAFTVAAAITGSVQATTGRHILACICHPPSGGTGTAELFYDDTLMGSALWNMQPQTTYLVSGNSVQNVWLRGRLGFAGIGRRDDPTGTRKGVQSALLRAFG
jgi:hypothetical protein